VIEDVTPDFYASLSVLSDYIDFGFDLQKIVSSETKRLHSKLKIQAENIHSEQATSDFQVYVKSVENYIQSNFDDNGYYTRGRLKPKINELISELSSCGLSIDLIRIYREALALSMLDYSDDTTHAVIYSQGMADLIARTDGLLGDRPIKTDTPTLEDLIEAVEARLVEDIKNIPALSDKNIGYYVLQQIGDFTEYSAFIDAAMDLPGLYPLEPGAGPMPAKPSPQDLITTFSAVPMSSEIRMAEAAPAPKKVNFRGDSHHRYG